MTLTTLPPLPLQQFTLANGLRVVMSQDDSVPVVSIAVYYDVGSRNERPGRTGFAHLFEHMMFQGSENVGKTEHFQFISKAGGTMNGTTSEDRTNYYETLPASQLPLALWLESDRMRSLNVNDENFENQRKVVQEEKRQRVDNVPYVNAILRLNEMTFQNFANAHSVIGSMEDLDDATTDDVREFFRIYYAPNNAVLSIVGSFDPEEARALVEQYFADIPAQPAPPPIDVDEPEGVAVRHEQYPDQFAPLPAFIMAWKTPARRSPATRALTLAGSLLFDGESSRLYQKLVKGEESVTQLIGSFQERRGPSALWIGAIPKPGHNLDQIRAAMLREVKLMATEGPTAEEMGKLRNQLLNDEVRTRQSSMFRAQRIAEFALYDGDPNLINEEFAELIAVTPDDIRQAVAKYLDTEERAQIEVVPAAAATA